MDRVMVFGLTDKETDMVRNCTLKIELLPFEVFTDVIAHYAEVTILNPRALEPEERLTLVEFYREIDPTDESVILTTEDTAFDGISFVETIPDLFDYPDSIKMILMQKFKTTKRDVNFSRRIMLAIKILHLIATNPGITTRKLTEMAQGVSERSVKRYIRSLQMAGILIDYRDKGWVCEMDPRELF